jgi:DNA polymerase I-like protein with 3'-5' exonuclease and polymerase domains
MLPITRKISELRSLGVFNSTFVQAPLDTDGRIRTSFNICGTETYRFASSKNAFGTGLNCQNIPKGGETEDGGLELPNVRNLFIPDQGHTMFDIDLDSADLRIVTWESNCAWMKDHFANGRKPYIEVMKEYYHNQSMSKKSHPREYAMFKSLCHGTNYLGTADGIAPRIGLLVAETERIQKWYFGLCPEIRKWQEDIKQQVAKRRWIQNVFGYKIHFFDKIEGTIFNQAVAWIPQSSVACLINRGYVNITDNLPEVEVLLQVHDSLVGQFESHHGDWALRRIVEECEVPLPYDDPLVIPVGIVSSKKSWGECG